MLPISSVSMDGAILEYETVPPEKTMITLNNDSWSVMMM